MQGSDIGFRIRFHQRVLYFRNSVVGFEGQYTGQHRFFFSIVSENLITLCSLLQRANVAGVELDRALEVLQGLFPAPLAPLDVALKLDYPGIIGQGLAGNFQFSQSAVIIEVSVIKILRTREVRFTSIRTEPKRGLNGRFR